MLAVNFRHFMKYGSSRFWNLSVLSADLWRLRVRLPSPPVLNPTTSTTQMSAKGLEFNSSVEFIESTKGQSSTGEMSAIKSTDISPETDADYAKPLSLLKFNPPEQRLDIHMPYSQHLLLEDAWSKFMADNNISGDKRYLLVSKSIIKRYPAAGNGGNYPEALHSYTAAVFREIIASGVNEYRLNTMLASMAAKCNSTD
ncbi:hypothetical protein V1517DRAFT_376170 [Lipomyces orientalis]|uniref:Uncharacterized protein n=1 Tax=Lipomyces orientalis TaxID=1233043 RepID=A0ACC3TFR9_9ASCO